MSTLEKIKKAQSIVGLLFATVLVIPFQVLILFTAIFASIDFQNNTANLAPNGIPFLVGYFVLTIVYCAGSSLVFHPKRIVSPINVQVGTAFVLSAILIINMLDTTKPTTTSQALTLIGNLSGILIVLALFLVAVGFVQFLIVRWVVGLNFDSIDRASFTVKMSPEDFLRTVGDILHDVWEFNRRKDNPKAKTNIIWVLKTRDPYGNSVVLTVGSVLGNNNKSVLVTVAYHASSLGVSKSKTASEMRNSIINDIKERLMDSKRLTLTPTDIDDHVSVKARNHALAITRSKIEITREFFQSISRYYLYALIATVIAFLAISIAFAIGLLDSGTYVGAVIVVAVALIFDLGASVRDELSRREIEEID
jgi:hypothetical protein